MTSLLKELLITENKKDDARRMIKPMIIRGTYSQEDMEKKMMQRLNIKPATADTYYHMIVKELNLDDDTQEEEDDDGIGEEDDLEVEEEPDSTLIPDIEFDDDGQIVSGLDNLEDGQFASDGNPNKRGVLRIIKDAHLVYKRQNDAGLFDELWIFNSKDNMKDSLTIKRDILSATDIPYRQTKSEDGSQEYSMYTMGDVQFLEIKGLPQ